MTGLDLETVSSEFEKKPSPIQAYDWRWEIIYDPLGMITIRNPSKQLVLLNTSHRNLNKAYEQHLHTTLDKQYVTTLRALAIEHGLDPSGLSRIKLLALLRTCFRKPKPVEIEMGKFFAERSDKGIENIA